jgi:small subunit ribosomal protein S1
MDKSKGNVLVSRRKIAENEKATKRASTLSAIQEGQIVKGKVTGLTNFGAFVDVGGVEGLLHNSDLSWNRGELAQKTLKPGQEIEVKVLKYDSATHRISLGRKQLLTHPWEGLETKYPIGSIVKGKVKGLAEFGAFVELEPGIEGLIHVSEFSWTERIKKPQGHIKVGQEVEVKMLNIDRANEKISLSLRRAGPSPWENAMKAYPLGSKVEGEITHIAPFGAFVKLSLGIEALLKTQDISWTERISAPQQVLKEGQKITAVVLEVNPQDEKIAIGLKQLNPDPLKVLTPGQQVNGVVSKVGEFGVIVKLESGLEGLIRSSELHHGRSMFSDPEDRNSRNQPQENPYKEGDAITASVLKVMKKERKLELSVRRYEQNQERELLKKYSQTGRLTLGETTGWNSDSDKE